MAKLFSVVPFLFTEEGQRLLEPDFQTLNKKLNTFVLGCPYTAYVELGR